MAGTTANIALNGVLTSDEIWEDVTMASEDYVEIWKVTNYTGAFKRIPPWEMALKITFSVVLMIASLIGNFMVIFVVLRNKRMRTTTNFYIVNLAVSDLLITTCCMWVHLVEDLTEGFVLGNFFCKLNSFSQALVSVSSVLTLMLIACDRFFGIVFAMKAHMTDRRASVFLVLVWIVSIVISAPLLVYRKTFQRQWLDHLEIWCTDDWPETINEEGKTITAVGKKIYYTVLCFFLFFIPIIVMAVAYILIIRRLWSSRIPGEQLETESKVQDRVKKKVVIMLVIILSVFVACWLPFQVGILYIEFRTSTEPLPQWFKTLTFSSSFVAFSNSAFNPIIYAGFNENFRKGFKDAFKNKPRRRYSSIEMRQDSCHSQSLMSNTQDTSMTKVINTTAT